MGPLAFGHKEEHIFLGREIAQHQDYSENTAQEIDQEVKRFVKESMDRARTILVDNRDGLERVAEALLERETLGGKEVKDLVEGKKTAKPESADKTETHTEEKPAAHPEKGKGPIPGGSMPGDITPKPATT